MCSLRKISGFNSGMSDYPVSDEMNLSVFFIKKSLGVFPRFLASIVIDKMAERKTNGFGCQKLFYFLFFIFQRPSKISEKVYRQSIC